MKKQEKKGTVPKQIGLEMFSVIQESAMPVYEQLTLCYMSAASKFPVGSEFPSLREIAENVVVNINTVQKGLSPLITLGVVTQMRGVGARVLSPTTAKTYIDNIVKRRVLDISHFCQISGMSISEFTRAVSAVRTGGASKPAKKKKAKVEEPAS